MVVRLGAKGSLRLLLTKSTEKAPLGAFLHFIIARVARPQSLIRGICSGLTTGQKSWLLHDPVTLYSYLDTAARPKPMGAVLIKEVRPSQRTPWVMSLLSD